MEPRPPAYRIESDRLVLRCWQPGDLDMLHRAVVESIDHLLPWMEWAEDEPISKQKRLGMLRRWRGMFDRDEDYVYGIFDAEESRVVGGSGLHMRRGEGVREIGYWIHADFTERGLATEATAALTRVGFEVDGVQRIEIRVVPDHAISARIPEKLGFEHEGTLRNAQRRGDGTHDDMTVWGMTPESYRETPIPDYAVSAYDVLGREFSLD